MCINARQRSSVVGLTIARWKSCVSCIINSKPEGASRTGYDVLLKICLCNFRRAFFSLTEDNPKYYLHKQQFVDRGNWNNCQKQAQCNQALTDWLFVLISIPAKPIEIDPCLVLFHVLATTKVIWGQVLTCDSLHSWQLYSAAPLGKRLSAPWPDIPHSHIILTLSKPVLAIS